MKASIQVKVLALCTVLVLITTFGISLTYYFLTKQDKNRESRERIQVAFDIALDGFQERLEHYTRRLEEFVSKGTRIGGNIYLYKDEASRDVKRAIGVYLLKMANELKQFAQVLDPDRLLLYNMEKQLMILYYQTDERQSVGGYVPAETGEYTYLPMNDFELQGKLLGGDYRIEEHPFPIEVMTEYEGEVPADISHEVMTKGSHIGIRVAAPVYNLQEQIGFLVTDVFYDQELIERYASLSKTQMNLFAGRQLSVGTLPEQATFDPASRQKMLSCQEMLYQEDHLSLTPVRFGKQQYYQGACTFLNGQNVVGAMTVSLSQAIEQAAILQILKAVLIVSGIAVGLALTLSVLMTRRPLRSIHHIVNVIVAAASGDLRSTARVRTHDEIGMLADKLNQMIGQLRTISSQVQGASNAVSSSADTILSQMESLIHHIEQQSSSVDNTTYSIETIKEFIDVVAHKTNDLLAATSQILASIQQTRASIQEVTTITGDLTSNLEQISQSIEQVNQSVKHISDNTAQLENVAQHTETEIHRIDESLKDVSHNAEQTQQLAKETMDAATSGEESVDASIQGMTELKNVVADTVKIISEVNEWGEQVSSILDIVDEITEQTTLLSLNASIISAQAGVHGRGFAVVADEIKELANRTKYSTKEISTLVRELQRKTEEGVTNTLEGLQKADQGMELATAVKDSLNAIIEKATRSSARAEDTAHLIQQTAASSQSIDAEVNKVTQMVSTIRKTLQEEEQNVEHVVGAVENLSGMSTQVNRATIEQRRSTEEIERNMEDITAQFSGISEQTETLQQDANQIVSAMHTVESTTQTILQNTTDISNQTIKNLVDQSVLLQKIVSIFKVS